MKGYLLLLMILIGSNFAGLSQTTDTICIPLQQAKKVYAAAAQKRVADSLLTIANSQLYELKAQVLLLAEKEQEQRNYFNREISNLENQIALYKDQVVGYEKIVRREKRKRFFSNLLGGLATAGAVYLAVTK